MQIAKNTVASIHYTLTDDAGSVLDSSEDAKPLAYLHGCGQIIDGLEAALEGHRSGDRISVAVEPEKAYGPRHENLVQQVPRNAFQGVEQIQPGMRFTAESDRGPLSVTVTHVADDTVTVDGNHPLAGKTLHFEVQVAEVRAATDEELAHGHVHGPGGHSHD